ncbi:cupin domain-containing protein [Pseudorhodobacter turbinis]|uniref:Cupin domain-containing protein n=1 Tax=Pseudorhodobacter turbinis TaxID=2500533 RepID=A0A4P8EDE6_9RHOB|nr:cupin domain-containing protein [Pseudorhodobacter turbinis]QCO54375.1 cupin domain-containing protein [Pseudorhodobacter turbinis]
MQKGVTEAKSGLNNHSWNVVGQTYVPKLLTDEAFVWHATLPADSFVPPHIHTHQDEWIYVISGALEVEFMQDIHKAAAGDTVKMPRGEAHGIFNRSGQVATCIFGVAPSRKLYDLFVHLDGVTDPAELTRISALYEVNFLPPPDVAE